MFQCKSSLTARGKSLTGQSGQSGGLYASSLSGLAGWGGWGYPVFNPQLCEKSAVFSAAHTSPLWGGGPRSGGGVAGRGTLPLHHPSARAVPLPVTGRYAYPHFALNILRNPPFLTPLHTAHPQPLLSASDTVIGAHPLYGDEESRRGVRMVRRQRSVGKGKTHGSL
jgi:hypothetical protein